MLISVLVFIVFLIMGVPIAFAIGATTVIFLVLLEGIPMGIVAQRMFTGLDSFPFMAIPFFILAGELMNQAQITP